ncbi:hypothetical protein AB4Z45_24090 [Paenibacillus sp. MCAF9]
MKAKQENSKLGTLMNKREEAYVNELIHKHIVELANHNELEKNSE